MWSSASRPTTRSVVTVATIRRTYCCQYLDIQVKHILLPESLQALPGAPAAAPAKNGDAQSDDAFSLAVSGQEQSLAELFALDRVPPNWTAFGESVRLHHDPPSWFDELSQYLRDPNTSDYPAYTPFLRNKEQYQPLLYRVQKRDAGESVCRILFYKTKAAHYPFFVSDFSELMDKLVEQLKRNKNERTYFMAYTPALGFLALPETEWDKLREAMIGNAKKTNRLICPSEPDIQSFHQDFMGRQTKRTEKIEQKLIDSANQTAEQFIKELEAVGGRVRRRARSTLPSYYLFFWGILGNYRRSLFSNIGSAQWHTNRRDCFVCTRRVKLQLTCFLVYSTNSFKGLNMITPSSPVASSSSMTPRSRRRRTLGWQVHRAQ
jgi:hypothetical protein